MARSLRMKFGPIATVLSTIVLAIALFGGLTLCHAGITIPGFSGGKDDTQDPFEARNLAHPVADTPERSGGGGPAALTARRTRFPATPSRPLSEVNNRRSYDRQSYDRQSGEAPAYRARPVDYQESAYRQNERGRRLPDPNRREYPTTSSQRFPAVQENPSTGADAPAARPAPAEYQPRYADRRDQDRRENQRQEYERRRPDRPVADNRFEDRQDRPTQSPLGELMPDQQIIARIGDDVVLFGELAGPVNQQLQASIRSGELKPEQIDAARDSLVRQGLQNLIEQRMVVASARRDLPPEAFPRIKEQVNQQFDKTQLKSMMAKAKVNTPAELDSLLRKSGSSITRQRQLYFQRSLTSQWMHKEVDYDPEVTHEDLLKYYREHRADYASKASAQWEELFVRFDKFNSKAEAYDEIARMGNDVWRGRTTFAEVAKVRSHGISASGGGKRSWTTQGSLVSDAVDQALFSQPVGQLGPIVECKDGFCIARVVERKPFQVKPFLEAQVKIRGAIRKEKVDKNIADYLAKVRKQTPVWTIFDARRPTNQPTRR